MIQPIIIRNKYFKIVFDRSTNRPHLIQLCYNKKYKTIYDFSYLLYNKWKKFVCKSMTLLDKCIFSIHFGSYQSIHSPHFHAHYLIPIKSYNKLSKEYHINNTINSNKWKLQLIQDGIKYKQSDTLNIHNHKSHDKPLPKLPDGYRYKFHTNQPRIAIYNKDPTKNNDLNKLIDLMLAFILYYKLNIKKIGGAHLCLQHNLHIDNSFKNFKAYIQLDIINYYKINNNRKKWLLNFKKHKYIVMT